MYFGLDSDLRQRRLPASLQDARRPPPAARHPPTAPPTPKSLFAHNRKFYKCGSIDKVAANDDDDTTTNLDPLRPSGQDSLKSTSPQGGLLHPMRGRPRCGIRMDRNEALSCRARPRRPSRTSAQQSGARGTTPMCVCVGPAARFASSAMAERTTRWRSAPMSRPRCLF